MLKDNTVGCRVWAKSLGCSQGRVDDAAGEFFYSPGCVWVYGLEVGGVIVIHFIQLKMNSGFDGYCYIINLDEISLAWAKLGQRLYFVLPELKDFITNPNI